MYWSPATTLRPNADAKIVANSSPVPYRDWASGLRHVAG